MSIALLALLLLATGTSHVVSAEVLALIAFDENITWSPEQVADLVAASGADVLFQGQLLRPSRSPVDGLLLRTTEEQFAFLASGPGMLPFPFSYLPSTNESLAPLGYGCSYLDPGLDIGSCLAHVWTTAAPEGSEAAALQAIQEVGGIAESTGHAFVPAGQLANLAADARIGAVQLVVPYGGYVPGPFPSDDDEIYFRQLFLGSGHRFLIQLTVESERVPNDGLLSRSGKRLYVSRDGGAFWIFEPANPEVFVKLLDGCSLNGHYWLFVSGLTDLGTRLGVSDFGSETVRIIETSDGEPYPSVFDTEAFPCN
jgi:hypothetical protein